MEDLEARLEAAVRAEEKPDTETLIHEIQRLTGANVLAHDPASR